MKRIDAAVSPTGFEEESRISRCSPMDAAGTPTVFEKEDFTSSGGLP